MISIADVNRDHVYADAVRDVYVRLANEGPKGKGAGCMWKNCEDDVRILGCCSTVGRTSRPGLGRREDFPEARLLRATSSMKALQTYILVHSDDFFTVGPT